MSFSIDQFNYDEENLQTTAFQRQNTQNVAWMKRQFSACQTPLCSTVSQLFEPQVQKMAVFTYRSPHFCFPWRCPCDYHAICSMDGKIIQCLPNPSQFPSYTMLKSMHKSKNRYFYHIFVSPGDAPGAITLNVIWMEREFDAYKIALLNVPI